ALAADPDDQQTHSDLHTCLRMLNKEAEAEVHLEKMKERDADIERFSKALLAFIQKPTEDVALRTEFAGLCLRLGHTEIGLRHLKRCVKLDPTYRPAHKKLAEYYEKVGDKDTSLTHKKLGEAEK
ncbi:MAG TPA: hypothetical protein VGZ25_02475, partial [Gemmataceae bacterium]|nr:hypothetical protein [Gemmataceae bacterium]